MANTQIGNLTIVLSAQTQAFVKGLADAKSYAFDSASAIVGSLQSIGTQISKLNFDDFKKSAKSLELVGGIAAGVGVAIGAAVIGIAKQTAEQAKQMDKLSQSYGVSIETVSSLRVAAKITGVELETMTMGMGRLAKNAATVAESTGGSSQKGAAAAFAALGISVKQLRTDLGSSNGMTDMLGRVAEAFSKMPDSAGKTALAIQIFGRSGAALIPFLNEGREGLQKMQEVSAELGLTWGTKSAESAKVLTEQFEILDLKSVAFKEQLAKGLIPALNDLAGSFVRVGGGGKSFATALGEGLGGAVRIIGEAGKAFATFFGFIQTGFDQLGSYIKNMNAAAINVLRGDFSGAKVALENTTKESRQIWDEYVAGVGKLWTAPSATAIGGGGGKGGSIPGFGGGGAGPVIGISGGLDELTKKTQSLLDSAGNQFDKDPLSRMAEALQEQIQKIQVFQNLHPEAIWASLNGQVNKLKTALAEVNEQLQANINTALKMSGDKGIAEMLGGIPVAIPNVSGATQAKAQQLRLERDLVGDVNQRNKEGLDIYLRTRTFEEQRADELKKINILLEKGAIDQQTYNRSVANMGGDGSVKGGIGAGLQKFAQQWQGWGVAAFQGTQQVLGRMQNSFANFFTSIVEGTKGIGQAFSELGLSILDSMISAFANIVAQWLVTQVVMKAISVIFGTDMQDQSAKQKKANAGDAASAAALAGANTLAKTSAIYPPPFPELLAGLAYGMGMGFSGLASAAGGMEVNRDQLAMVHKNEMVLPAYLSSGFKNIIAGQQPAMAGGWGGDVHFHVSGTNDPAVFADKAWSILKPRINRMRKDSGY